MGNFAKKIALVVSAFSLLTLVLPMAKAVSSNPTGQFGQPHNYVVSGDYTFVVSTQGKVDRVHFYVYPAETTELDVSKAVFSGDQTSVTVLPEEGKYFNLVWNSSAIKDGDYKLYAQIECDSCSANGWRDIVKHATGDGYLEFSVDNPDPTPTPTQSPVEDTCSKDLDKAIQLSETIYTKHNTNMLFIDNFLQQTTLFYQKNGLSVSGFEEAQQQTEQMRKKASDKIVLLSSGKGFSCEGSIKNQVETFLADSEATRDALDDYKDSVISLIVSILDGMK